MLCSEIMKRNVEYVSSEDSVAIAAQKMRDRNVGFLPVCDGSMRALGTLTDRDITIRGVAERRPASTSVSEVMSHDVIACKPTDDVLVAEQLMGRHQKSRMMCIDEDDRLVGIISLSDIAQREDGVQAARTMRQITEREVRV